MLRILIYSTFMEKGEVPNRKLKERVQNYSCARIKSTLVSTTSKGNTKCKDTEQTLSRRGSRFVKWI